MEDGTAAQNLRCMKRKFSFPSTWSFRFLRLFCPDDLLEEIEGDIIQKYNKDVKKYGEGKAGRRLIWNAIRFFRWSIIARNKFDFLGNQNLMFRTNSKIIGRQIAGTKLFPL